MFHSVARSAFFPLCKIVKALDRRVDPRQQLAFDAHNRRVSFQFPLLFMALADDLDFFEFTRIEP